MSREETVESIKSWLSGVKNHEDEFVQTVIQCSLGRIDLVPYNLDTADPKVEFKVYRKGTHRGESFGNLQIALVYLYRQTPHL